MAASAQSEASGRVYAHPSFAPPPEFTDDGAINMRLDDYDLRHADHSQVAGVPTLTQPSSPTLELQKYRTVKYKPPRKRPPKPVPIALRDSSPYRRTARPQPPRPTPAHELARKQLRRTVRAMRVHEARLEHGVSGDKYGGKKVRNRERVKLPPPLPPIDPASGYRPGDTFVWGDGSEAAGGTAAAGDGGSTSGGASQSGWGAGPGSAAPQVSWAQQAGSAMGEDFDPQASLAEHLLGPDTIKRWLEDCKPGVRVKEEGRPVGFAPDGTLLVEPPPSQSAGSEWEQPWRREGQRGQASDSGGWEDTGGTPGVGAGDTFGSLPQGSTYSAGLDGGLGGSTGDGARGAGSTVRGSTEDDGLFQGDSFVDHGYTGAGDSGDASYMAGSGTGTTGPGGMRATRAASGAITHVPSSQPAGTGAVTASAPPGPHVGRHTRGAASMRDPHARDKQRAQQAQQQRRREQRAARRANVRKPRHLSPLKHSASAPSMATGASQGAGGGSSHDSRGDGATGGGNVEGGRRASQAATPDGRGRSRSLSPAPGAAGIAVDGAGSQPQPGTPAYRLEPSFYLVDRQAVPARMPTSLQRFWERNPQLLPKDALSPANFRKVKGPVVTRHTFSGAPRPLVEAANKDQQFGVRHNYDLSSFDVSSSAKLDQVQRAEGVDGVEQQLSGTMRSSVHRGPRGPGGAGFGTTSGVADVEIMGVSHEMKDDLARVLAENQAHQIGTSEDPLMELWHDEVGSSLARPLDASVFLSQSARYTGHPSSSVAFDPYRQPWDSRVGVFPYGAVAHEASSRIQRAWVRYQHRKAHAALVLQALFRGYRVRVPFKVSRLLSTSAAVRMQSLLRMRLGKKRAYNRWCEVNYGRAAKFQACWRGLHGRRRVKRLRAARDRRAATLIQTAARGMIARLEHRVRIASAKRLRLQRMFRSHLLLQRVARGYIGRCRARRRLAWAVVIMDWWRALVRTNLGAARDIQRVTRGFMGRRRVKHMRATAIQTVARRMAARRRVERLKARLRAEEEARWAEETETANRRGDAGVEETLDFLKTKRGKERLKQERSVVKAERREETKRRKTMSRVDVRRAEAADAFHLFDTDASEAIDRDEFKAIMEELCMPFTEVSLRAAFDRIDVDKSEFIDLEEFVNWFVQGESDDESEEEDEGADEKDGETPGKPKKKAGLFGRMFGSNTKKKKKKAKKKKEKEAKKKLSAAQKAAEKRKADRRKGRVKGGEAAGGKEEEKAPSGDAASIKEDATFALRMMRLKLRGKKFVKDILGRTEAQMAQHKLVATARADNASAARRRFRTTRPPRFACEDCVRTFALREDYLAHREAGCGSHDQRACVGFKHMKGAGADVLRGTAQKELDATFARLGRGKHGSADGSGTSRSGGSGSRRRSRSSRGSGSHTARSKASRSSRSGEAGAGGGSSGPGRRRSGRATPTSGRRTPTSGRRTPTSGRRTPTSGRRTPTSGRKTPTSGRRTPTSGR